VHTTLYGLCTVHGRVHGPCTYTASVHGRLYGRVHMYTAVYRSYTWPVYSRVHGRVHSRVQYTRPCNGRVHGPCTLSVHGRVHGLYMAEYTVVCTSTRPVHETYRILDFLTNCCNYVREQNKASFCLYRKFIKHGVKRGSGIKILYLLTGPIPCPTNVSDRLD